MRRNLRGLKNVQRQKRNGKTYRYHRVTRARLPDLPEDHPDFIAAWLEEENRTPQASPGTLAERCQRVLGSTAMLELNKDYRRALRLHMDEISEKYGKAQVKHIQDRHIEADLADLPPNRANARLKAWRKLLPGIQVKKRPTPKTEGHKPWTPEQIAAYRGSYLVGSVERRAFELLFWTAARTVDAVTLSPGHVGEDGILIFKQSKTGALAYVPWTCPLPEWADWDDERDLVLRCAGEGATFLETAAGAPRSHKGLSNLISQSAREIGIPRSAHGLRKARLTAIADAGGSTHAIMAWGGHLSMSEAEAYTRAADRKRLVSRPKL